MTTDNHKGQKTIALFDLDHTLIPIDSDWSWGDFTTSMGWTDADVFKHRNELFYEQYKAGTLNIHEYVRFATAAICNKGKDASLAAHSRYMRDVIEPVIKPQALQLVQQHRDAGDEIVIVTATNEFVTRAIADAFGVKELIAVRLKTDPATGWYNGEIEGVPSFREGKVTRVEAWLKERGLDWHSVNTVFYSDSVNDIPLMEKASEAVATNPDDRLRAHAISRGWRILQLFS